MSDLPHTHVTVLTDNDRDWCVVCQRIIETADRTEGDQRIRVDGKASCMACVVEPLGFEAAHVCGYPDDVAAASGVP